MKEATQSEIERVLEAAEELFAESDSISPQIPAIEIATTAHVEPETAVFVLSMMESSLVGKGLKFYRAAAGDPHTSYVHAL